MSKISDVAKRVGVHPQTIRKWERLGLITPVRTPLGQRRYSEDDVRRMQQNHDPRFEYIYCRVSSKKQSADLERQIKFMQGIFPDAKLISDIGSGVNFKRPGLKTLLDELCGGNIKKIAVSYKDRLCRIGFELFEQLAEIFKCEIIAVNNVETSPEEELIRDLISITTSFSARIHGLRKYKSEMSSLLTSKEETESSLEELDKANDQTLQLDVSTTANSEETEILFDDL